MVGDALTQAAAAEGLGIAERMPGSQGGNRSLDGSGGGAGARLAHLHPDHAGSGGPQRGRLGVGRSDHVHHHEGGRRRAATDFQCHGTGFGHSGPACKRT